MAYTKQTWANVPATTSPMNATRLNNMEAGIAAANTSVTTIASLRALTDFSNVVNVLGYYAVGDGGGGVFRWDATDTTSTDNGGTIITPSSALSSSGRWKRVYEGEVNARWFGVNPSQLDNTAALQAAVNWVSLGIGGTVFIPMGFNKFMFDQGTSGLSTITISSSNVLIRGEGPGSMLQVTNHAYPNQLNYFFTFSLAGRGQGGGVKDLTFYGNAMLKWGIYLNTWRNANFERISAYDLHGGILDAEANDTSAYGESIYVDHLDHTGSTGSVLTQYGVRFRGGSAVGSHTWSDCWISNCLIVLCWDTAVVLDGVQRFLVRNIGVSNNGTSSNTITNTSKSGCLHVVRITSSATLAAGLATGSHIIDGLYLESQQGSETPATNQGVLIDVPLGVSSQVRYNKVSNININGNVDYMQCVDGNGFGRANNNINRTPIMSSITSSATPAINVNQVGQLNITALAVNITSMTSGLTGTPYDGQLLEILIKGTAARTITWGTAFLGSGSQTLLATTATTKTHLNRFRWDDVAAKWICTYVDATGY